MAFREEYGVDLGFLGGCYPFRSLVAYCSASNERMAQAIRVTQPGFDLDAAQACDYEAAAARYEVGQEERERRPNPFQLSTFPARIGCVAADSVESECVNASDDRRLALLSHV